MWLIWLLFLGCSFLPCHPCKVLCLVYHLQPQCPLQAWVIHHMPGLRTHHHHMYQSCLHKHKLMHQHWDQVYLFFCRSSINCCIRSFAFYCILNHVKIAGAYMGQQMPTNMPIPRLSSLIMIIFTSCIDCFRLGYLLWETRLLGPVLHLPSYAT